MQNMHYALCDYKFINEHVQLLQAGILKQEGKQTEIRENMLELHYGIGETEVEAGAMNHVNK